LGEIKAEKRKPAGQKDLIGSNIYLFIPRARTRSHARTYRLPPAARANPRLARAIQARLRAQREPLTFFR
jgi:hypothetical protein